MLSKRGILCKAGTHHSLYKSCVVSDMLLMAAVRVYNRNHSKGIFENIHKFIRAFSSRSDKSTLKTPQKAKGFPPLESPRRLPQKEVGLKFSIKFSISKTFSFFSPEHKQKFTAEDVKLKMEKEPDNPDRLCLNFNGQNIIDWFRE